MPVKARSARPKSNPNNKKSSLQNARTPSKRTKRAAQTSPRPSEDEKAVSGPEDAGDTYQEEDDEDDVKSLHSDALDDDDSDQETEKHARKRKRASPVKSRRAKASSPRKRRKNTASDEDEEEEGYDLKEGQQIVGKVVQAPKTGRGTRCVYILVRYEGLIHCRSSTGSDISKYVQLPFATQKARMQRPRMVRTPSVLSVAM